MLSLRRISHSASLRATGSDIAAWAWVASSAFCLRTSPMTFSRASLSACDVEDVAATAAGATCLRGGKAACWRVAGARTGGAGAGAAAAAGAAGAGVWAAGALVCAVDFGTTLRAIGRGFGSGTFGFAQASKGKAASPTASARPVASAVDRKAAARAEEITVFLCGGESFNRSSLRSIQLNMWTKC